MAVGVLASAPVPYTAPSGDLGLDGKVDAQDLQCEVLLFSALTAAGNVVGDQCQNDGDCVLLVGPSHRCRPGFGKALRCLPDCMSDGVAVGKDQGVLCLDPMAKNADCIGTTQVRSADLDCDGAITNTDFLYLVAVIMKMVGWPGTADHDGDGQLNFCDLDSDGDGDPDASDCEVLDGDVGALAPELCNGKDDNCNGKVDDWLGTVTCGVGICVHDEPACIGGIPNPCDPLVGAQPEVCDGLDNDCNAKTDDGPGDELCKDFLAAPNVLALGCLGGTCFATVCQPGWYDVNGAVQDGCECNPDKPGVKNQTCGESVDLGIIGDSPATQVVVKSNEPTGEGDWYTFIAKDVNEANTDSFRSRVRFLDNPGDTFVFDVHWESCAVANRICSGTTLHEWYTDFIIPSQKAGIPAIPGPDASGGGESNCGPDADHALSPNDFSDDTSDAGHQCRDNSARFYVRVYVAPGKKKTCSPYKLEISNGMK